LFTCSIGDFKHFDSDVWHDQPHDCWYRIYKVEGEQGEALYVGKSIDAVMRMYNHLGRAGWLHFTQFDQLLEQPTADKWALTLYSEDDVDAVVEGKRSISRKVDMLEARMIRELQPKFNHMGR
jgi:hypothetical protein